MFNRSVRSIVLIIPLLMLIGCTAAPVEASTAVPISEPTKATPRTLVLGEVSEAPQKKIDAYQPLADYLAIHLGEYGFNASEVRIAPDQDTMIQWLKDGTVDLYFASPYSAMIMTDQAGAQIFLRRWKGGVDEYKSLILVRKDSGIQSLADLRGHVVAFDEPFSTTAYMLPLAYMIQSGLTAVEVSAPDSAVDPAEVGYVFALGQENVTSWLASGKVNAGAFSDQDLKDVPADLMDQLNILVETEPLPRYLALTRPGMSPSEIELIKVLLVGLDQTSEGPEILQTFEKTAKFDDMPNTEAMLARMRQLYDLVKGN